MDTHAQDRQLLSEHSSKQRDDARRRKTKSRSRLEIQEKERQSKRVCAMSPDRHEATKARDQVGHMSPNRRKARQSRDQVGHMSPNRREARQSRDQVAHMSPQRLKAKRARNQQRYEPRNGDNADSENSDVEPPSAVRNDARRYAEAIQDTCVFLMCAVCAWEGGIDSMVAISDDIRQMLKHNTTLSEDFFHLCQDQTDSGIDLNYRRRVRMEMEEPGILKGIQHICVACHQKAKCGKPSNRVPISYSLAGGLFCGEPPDVLKQLWAVEVSMVALINPIVKITVESAYAHTSSKPNSFCIENDVIQIAQKLPRVPSKDTWAVFLHQGFSGKPDSQHQYRPHYVYEALKWLKDNNVLYRDVVLEFPDEWADAIDNAERVIEVESVRYTDADVEPVRRNELPAETDDVGHAANPSAVPSRDFFLVKSMDYGPTIDELKAVARSAQKNGGTFKKPALRRSLLGATIVQRHEAPDFDAMAFPVLYPFGFGHVPGKSIDVKYVEHRICSGGYYRRFQQTSNYLYTHYAFEMKRTVGGISVLAASKSNESGGMTAQDARDFLAFLRDEDGQEHLPAEKMARIRRFMRLVAPYAQRLPGTKVVMDQEKNKMRSIINSPVTREDGHWRWFVTHAQSDLFSPLVFDNIVTSTARIDYYDIEQRQSASDALTKEQRCNLLRQNPVITSRIWALQQKAFFNHVINGEALPLGGKVSDKIDKSEVQGRGGEHTHSMMSIKYDTSVPRDQRISDKWLDDAVLQDETKRAVVENLVGSVVTAKLLDAEPDQTWDWKQPGAQDIFSERFPDSTHPLRVRFDPNLDYSVNPLTNEPVDSEVRRQYRRIQSASFGHVCRDSCWKYKSKKPKQRHRKFRSKSDCRHGHPVPEHQKVIGGIFKHRSNRPQVCVDYDRKGRKRCRVLPARNNSHLAPCPVSPLAMLAHRGNSNIQYMCNAFGAVEYFTSYIGKVDEPECKAVIDSVIRLLSLYATDDEPSLKLVLKAVMNALTRERSVTSTQVADFFLGHKILTYSRSIKIINPRPSLELNARLNLNGIDNAEEGNDDSNVIVQSKQTQYRKAYSIFVLDQLARHNECNVSFFSFLTSFDQTRMSETRKRDPEPPLFSVDSFSGVVTNSKSFTTLDKSMQFTAHAKANVIHLVPYAPINLKDEKCCYALLLLYIPWPHGSENELLQEGQNAIQAWQDLEQSGNVPQFAQSIVACDIRRQEMDIGEPGNVEGSDSDNEEGDCSRPRRDSIAVEYNVPSAGNEEDALCSDSEDASDQETSFSIDDDNVAQISEAQFLTFQSFIRDLDERLATDEISVRKLTKDQIIMRDTNPDQVFPIESYDAAVTALDSMIDKLTPDQAHIFNTVTERVLCSDKDTNPLFAFLSGQGGVGKSEVLKTLKLWSDVTFGKTAGDCGSCLMSAPTGMSAFNIKGTTWHKAFKKSAYEKKVTAIGDVEASSVAALRAAFAGVKLIIIDELSLINLEQLWEINIKLKVACNDSVRQEMLFGGFHVLLGGDMYQLPPVGGKCIVTPLEQLLARVHATTRSMKSHFMDEMTHFFELTENIRARNETKGVLPPFAAALSHLRIGRMTANDKTLFNQRFVLREFAMDRAHPKAIWIFATNQECKQFNEMCTERLVKEGKFRFRVVAQHRDKRGQTAPHDENAKLLKVTPKIKKSADDLRVPYMDLAIGSRVKMLENLCVRAGIVNGAVGTVVGFRFVGAVPNRLKPSASSFNTDESIPNREIPVVLVQFDYDESDYARALANSCITGMPNVFPVVALASTVVLNLKGNSFNRWQLPLALSHGRTCHSCQGLTAHNGAVVTVSTRFFNYSYVASSRAKALEQLFFLPCAEGQNKGTMCFFEDLQHSLHPQRSSIEQFYIALRHKFCVTS